MIGNGFVNKSCRVLLPGYVIEIYDFSLHLFADIMVVNVDVFRPPFNCWIDC